MISNASGTSGRLNAFQRLMLQWTELHPYNATHVYRIARPADSEALIEALRQTYHTLGLGIVEIDASGRSYRHRTDHDPDVELVDGGTDSEARLADWVTREMNRPFERPRCRPWRFSLLDVEPDAHYVIATYDHWVADNTAARLLLRHVLDRYLEWNQPENRRRLDLYPGTFRDVFSRRLSSVPLLRAGMRSVGQWLRNRTAAQVSYSSNRQMDMRFELYHTPSGTADQLRHFARSLDATVHDVILAALGRAMIDVLPRRALRKGQAMSLGTIVNARGEAEEDLSHSLGSFLSYYLVRLAADKDVSLSQAVRRVAAASGPIKAGRRYLDSLVKVKFASALWPHLKPATKTNFMRKSLPMTAGVSNVCVRNDWMTNCGAGCITEYIRSAPTGPILPLTLAPTTLGHEMNVGISYRIAGFTREKIDGIMERFMAQIERPAGTRRGLHRRLDRPLATAKQKDAARKRELVAAS